MSDSSAQDLRLDDLHRAVARLRSRLPSGAPIVPLPSVRARDRGELTYGAVVPFGLGSSLFYDEQFGEYAAMDKPHLYLFEGTLASRHISSLLPLFEQSARDHKTLILAASDADEDVIAMLALNKQRGSMRGAILVPDSEEIPVPLRILQHATGGGIGAASDTGLRLDQPALPSRLVATLHETAIIRTPSSPHDPPTLGLLHVGGEDRNGARARARAARDIVARSFK